MDPSYRLAPLCPERSITRAFASGRARPFARLTAILLTQLCLHTSPSLADPPRSDRSATPFVATARGAPAASPSRAGPMPATPPRVAPEDRAPSAVVEDELVPRAPPPSPEGRSRYIAPLRAPSPTIAPSAMPSNSMPSSASVVDMAPPVVERSPEHEPDDAAPTTRPPREAEPSAHEVPLGRAPPEHDLRTPSPFDEPLLGAALDGPAESAEPFDERRRRLAEHGAWLEFAGPSSNGRRLLERIADAGAHGFDPTRYDLDGLRAAVVAAFERPPPYAPPALDSPERAALAYRFGRAFTLLTTDLGRGLVDARAVQRRLYRDRPDPDVDALREALVSGDIDVDDALDAVAPTHEHYRRLVDTMRKLLAERVTGGKRTRVDDDGSLRVGHRHDEVMRLKRRLIETGDLDAGTVVTPMFDAELVVSLEAFQKRHGIPPQGGSVDARTMQALNRTLENDLDDLAMSLERWRWMPRELGERHVFVNLPDYRLTMDNGAQRIVDMAVVIGATDHPTPSFSQDMSYLEFSPTWTVPASIAHRELLPRERKNPGYLKSRNFDFLKVVDGKLEKVPYDSVSHEELALWPFPYMLRQRGGGNNALGRMKFMMPNPYAIYLHDTPAKRHFALHDRAYSHGCVRLSDPERLATLLLQIDGRSRDEAMNLIDSPETRRARLKTPVPTHLAYFTTWVDENGALQRRADVYGHDPALRVALGLHGGLPSARFGTTEPPG